MTVTVTLPPVPRPVPPLPADAATVRRYAADLLAASAQIDDLGSFVTGAARIDDWHGLAASSYHLAIAPLGRRADAMSLALRGVARRCDAHADALARLLTRQEGAQQHRAHLVGQIDQLRARAGAATGPEALRLQAECDDCARQVRAYEADLDDWAADLAAEEEGMRSAFESVLTLEQVERTYGGAEDPADEALAGMPGPEATPVEVNAWWDGLTHAEQLAILAAAPRAIGNRDGIPAWARHDANTVALGSDLATWEHLDAQGLLTPDEERWLENARAARDAVAAIEAGIDPFTLEGVEGQLYVYDPTAFGGDGAIAVSAGSLDAAANVAVVVPGLGTDAESAPYQAERALTLYEASRYLDGGQTTASMFWIGYDAPDNVPWDEGWDAGGVVREDLATAGGERLADTIDGLRASRDGDPAHLTAIGHSYGSTTAGHAAHDHGIPVDDLVLVGSPGVGGDSDSAADTGVDPDHVWAGANSRDPVADLANHGWVHLETIGGGGLGDDPAEDDFGARRFQAESTTRGEGGPFADHSKYFEHDTESLHNISQIITGNYAAVMDADPVTDPWYTDPRDPEFDREPTAPDTWEEP